MVLGAQFRVRPQDQGLGEAHLPERLALVAWGTPELSDSISRALVAFARELETDPKAQRLLAGETLSPKDLQSLPKGYQVAVSASEDPMHLSLVDEAQQRLGLCAAFLSMILSLALALSFLADRQKNDELQPMSQLRPSGVLVLFMGWHVLNVVVLGWLVHALGLPALWPGLGLTLAYQLVSYGLMFGLLKAMHPKAWNLSSRISWAPVGWGYFSCFGLVLLCNLAVKGLSGQEPSSSNPLLHLFATSGPWGVWLLGGLVVLVGPFFEELMFRGWLLTGLERSWGTWGAILISSSFFALIHADLWATPALFCLGCIFALVAKRTGSLWGSIALHAMWNATTFVFVLANIA